MIKRIGLLMIFAIGFWGCDSGPKKPKNIVPENKYVQLLVELQLIRSYSENAETDSATVDSLTSEVYEKYGVSREQFHKSHNYYQHFPKKQKVRIEQAIEKLKMELVTKQDSTQRPDSIKAGSIPN